MANSMKIVTWDDAQTKQEIQKRYRNAMENRRPIEDRWIRDERTIYNTSRYASDLSNVDNILSVGLPPIDGSNAEVNVAYTFKNFRFIHAQMSANPPSVAMRPTSSDQEDHRKADAADRISRWALRQYKLQEKQDQMNLHALLYGTGVLKTVWDSTRGDIVGFDEESGELELEGDIAITVPFLWNIYLDPDAKCWDEVKFVFERIYMDYEEALAKWPDKQDQLKKARVERNSSAGNPYAKSGAYTELDDRRYNAVELLEYWETGLPTNGYLGRYCITLLDGDIVEPVRPSPFRFRRAGTVSKIEARDDIPDAHKEELIRKLPAQASLPYHILTDIDVPNQIWGKSAIEYASQLQDNLSKVDSAKLDNIQAHGVARLVLPESAELNEDALSDSPWDIIKITGNQPPYFMSYPQLMPDMSTERQNYITGINDVMGVNDSMFGQQQREQSGASMQYATNNGNMIRRRLFNKYVLAVESIYKSILNLIRKHWAVGRVIYVLGKEKALEAIDVKGTDIDGGYDVVGEYGVTLSLDPITRREEIITLQPLFEKAGVPPRMALKMMKLNELEGMYDRLDRAGDRQKEIFDSMVATRAYIPPKKYRDHENMIAWALDYFMSSEYENLDPEVQGFCEEHIAARAQLAAQEGPNGTGTAPAPIPAAPAVPGGPPAGPAPIAAPGAIPAPTGPAPAPAPAGPPVGA